MKEKLTKIQRIAVSIVGIEFLLAIVFGSFFRMIIWPILFLIVL